MKDGGPAFPRHYGTALKADREEQLWHGGMTLRDWFAGQALAGMLSCRAGAVMGLPKFAVAQDAWQMADSMLDAKDLFYGIENNELLKLRTEINCRIEHGAESGGHLEFVLSKLDAILGAGKEAAHE
jgi:hypothetical protein